ncbi:MAG TPA: hypothetical protein VJ748_06520 [Vitreimonas sp.]|jgi:hypothetical protein|nr:hypothetical protein [Vitreimonas sp.]
MRWVISAAFVTAIAGCGPDLSRLDRSFDDHLYDVVTSREIGSVPSPETEMVLRQLFDQDLSHVCVVYGGDYSPGVDYRWLHANEPPPISVDALRDLGSGQLDSDGMAAVIGVGGNGLGYVRRGWFGDGTCSDYSGGPYCIGVDSLAIEITEGTAHDNGRFAGSDRDDLS